MASLRMIFLTLFHGGPFQSQNFCKSKNSSESVGVGFPYANVWWFDVFDLLQKQEEVSQLWTCGSVLEVIVFASAALTGGVYDSPGPPLGPPTISGSPPAVARTCLPHPHNLLHNHNQNHHHHNQHCHLQNTLSCHNIGLPFQMSDCGRHIYKDMIKKAPCEYVQ